MLLAPPLALPAQVQEAAACYERVLALNPPHPTYTQTLCNVGVLHKARGELADAIRCYEAALAAAPGFAIVQACSGC